MEYLLTGITAAMTTATSLQYAGITPTDTTANVQTNYVLALTFSQTQYSGNTVILTIPAGITLNSGFVCTTSSAGISVACVKQSSQILVIKFTSTGTFTSASITISNFQNNWYASTFSFSLQTTTNDTTTYYV